MQSPFGDIAMIHTLSRLEVPDADGTIRRTRQNISTISSPSSSVVDDYTCNGTRVPGITSGLCGCMQISRITEKILITCGTECRHMTNTFHCLQLAPPMSAHPYLTTATFSRKYSILTPGHEAWWEICIVGLCTKHVS